MKPFLTKIYLFKFFDDFVLIYPLYVVMFGEFGIVPWQVGFLLALWSIVAFVLEVPSGVWADKYSRKNILFIGQLIRSAGYLIWLLYPTFTGFMLGFVCWGTKGALTSGTFQALVYDELKQYGKESEYIKVIGRSKTIAFAAILSASALASPAILLGYPFILIASCAAVLISGLTIMLIHHAPQAKSTNESRYFVVLKSALVEVLHKTNVLKLILYLALITALGGALEEFWPILAEDTGLPAYGLGIFLGMLSGFQALTSFFTYRIEILPVRVFYGFVILAGILLVIVSSVYTIPALLLIILFGGIITLIETVFDGKLQHAIGSKTRATITSVRGFLLEIFAIAVYLGVGFLAQLSSYQTSFMIFGWLIMLTGLIYIVMPGATIQNIQETE